MSDPEHMDSPGPEPARLGDLLQELGGLKPDALARALRLQSESGERIGVLLLRLGYIGERDLARALAEQLKLPFVDAAEYRNAPVLNGEVSAEFLKRAQLIPLAETEEAIVVAMADPLDEFASEALRLALGKQIQRRVGVPSEIEAARRRAYAEEASAMGQIVESIGDEDGQDQGDIQQLRDLASEAPIIRVVNLVISEALEMRASDIHFEPFENTLRVRCRVDGVLKRVDAPPAHSSAAVISRVKVMANLNIAERRLPQDGRMKLRIEGREIDMRVSTVPTLYGESVVLRILDKSSLPLDFPSLGFTPDILPVFEAVLERPHGIVLVTGPTGSGKTTTLYAALSKLNTLERKVLTVEDPVEYQLEGINQIQVKPQIGLGFAEALRSFLRQDPDVIMVGEMRDVETAKIAVQAALTGHQVFSTLHTNDSASSITRMIDMGVEDFLLSSTINAVLAQRLVRGLCKSCRIPYQAPPELLREAGFPPELVGPVELYQAKGCDACDGVGYRGRTGILELLVMTERVRRAVLQQADAVALRQAALEDGMVSMYQDGLRKVMAGVTTLEEVVRVTQE